MDLTGKLLIAMPGMGDPRFDHSVVYMCSHGDDGAMGLIVNKPSDLRIKTLLGQLNIACRIPVIGERLVHFGGPVEMSRGFVLHSADYEANLHSMHISTDFSMTATLDVLEDLASGSGPLNSMLTLGYSGWGPGQLEDEIAMNGWLTTEATTKLVFDVPDDEKWEAALATLGVDPLTLSASAGRA
ncbi:YqgE/AlgH family protein [Ruegeria sp. HKCCD6157]|uniref:YqgE/AlgH family protein n=1 Tax=Ruegeria sp. HKCCD6157 TaxID=2690707 RepID=UPI001493201D|nr:YqgE/AlgH family protein [Ruegeria sp. HKCCD6157]NOE27614.1 YqgE/AlgH family protein [Ruegeria sp. HKCCD6157]